MAERSYFVCTLGQAAQLPGHSWVSLSHLLDVQAEAHQDLPVVGMPAPKEDGEWTVRALTYVELLNATSAVAHRFTDEGSLPHRTPEDDVPTVIGLLSPSSLDFVITLFAAMRMGLSVLLIAPQCTPAAVSHLCLTTRVTHLVYDSTLSELAQDASRYAEGRQPLQLVPLPSSSVWSNVEPGLQSTFQAVLTPEKESSQTCFIYHSSGTTSGLPKPLPQTHRIMSVLHPHLPGSPACFSTTPLYHGGLADLVRSLNSAAMLYLFPPGVPITRTNILKSLAACGRFHAAQPSALQYHTGVKLLSCVPYVLKMLVENDGDGAALAFLRGLDFLGTGGAPLPQDLGDRLVREGVRLVSRYGSAECGFLMSSARDFANDREWQYLRSEGSGGALVFEEQEDETVELVIQSHWPCMTKMNRPDGSFATSDLYVRHPSIPDAWKYLGRKDDMLVLVNGKKVDPVPFETALNAAPLSSGIQEAVVFGVDRAYIGVMVIPLPSADAQEEEIRTHAWDVAESINATVSGHARVPARDMIVVLPPDSTFSKSSKGTVQRTLVYRHYSSLISGTYDMFETGTSDLSKISLSSFDKAQEYVLRTVREITSTSAKAAPVELDTDLFSYGVDSLQSARIRIWLQAGVELNGRELSSNVVYEAATARRLATTLYAKISGVSDDDDDEVQAGELGLMKELVQKYSSFKPLRLIEYVNGHAPQAERVLVLTGATGALGAHVLDQALDYKDIPFSEIVCLCRAEDDRVAMSRVQASLTRRCLPPLNASLKTRVTCLSAHLGDAQLGLGARVYEKLAQRVTDIIHAAWAVNFVGGLMSFEADHIRGVHQLIRLAAPNVYRNTSAAFHFCSSGATVLGRLPTEPIAERVPEEPESAAAMGYARSKWVAEHLCVAAGRTLLKGKVSVLRIGQLCGDTRAGVWNESEGWPLMLRTADEVGLLPDLQQNVFWLPVDVAAAAILDIVARPNVIASVDEEEGCKVFHIMSSRSTSWTDVCSWLRATKNNFDVVTPQKWVQAMEASEADVEKNPSRKLLGLWSAQYGHGSPIAPEPKFDTSRAVAVASGLRNVRVDGTLMARTFERWCETGFLRSNI